LSFRISFPGKIEIEKPKKNIPFKIFSDKSIKEIQDTIAKKKSVFIFTLRKGLATQTVCRDCGETVSCEKCLSPLVLYSSSLNKKERTFVCNRCGQEKEGLSACAACYSWNLMPLGIGTDTVFEELSKTLPKTKIFKLDKESAKTKAGAEKIIKEFEESAGSILIGTEMALYYLKNKIALSVIASFDSFWSIPNFKIGEKIIQLSTSIISFTENKFIIQTKNTEDTAILAVLSRNLLPFVRSELEDRRNLGYPPFKRFIKIKHLGNKTETLKAKQILKEIFKDYSPLIFSGFVERLKGKYATNALIKIDTQKWSLPELSLNSSLDETLLAKLLSLPPSFEVFVDPEDLL
jgi:primosomal protein N' (replication factor Y)